MKNTFSEDAATRFMAQGWQVIRVNNANNLGALKAAIMRAKSDLTRPSIIICKSEIGYGSPLAGSADCHGAPLGEANVAKLRENLGWTQPPFEAPEDVKEHCLAIAEDKCKAEEEWKALFAKYEQAYPMLAKVSPNIMSGSADLSPSTKTEIKGSPYFSPEHREGCNIHFGIREHAMSAICNGIQLHGGLRAVCSTFFSFADYMKPGIRMSGLMKLPVVYVMTHDSIGVGEDGPTHQPMEQLVMVRSIPNVNVIRPCDGKETAAAFVTAFTSDRPTIIVETRQNLPCYEHNSGEKALKGGYVIAGTIEDPDVLLIATGSEVEPCMEAKRLLAEEDIKARVISIPCMEIFDAQDEEYKEKVLPKSVKARVCVEAASHFAWYKYCRDYGELVTMTSFGVSGPAKQLFEHFGFTAENIVEKAKLSIENVKLNRYSH